jgi:16S rRNA (cytosine967-C5)-methyltransferase
LLLVGLYQLEYSRTAPHTVVDNAVSAARVLNGSKDTRGRGGLVNAILRNFMRKRSILLERAAESDVGRFSHPQWWIDKLRAQYPDSYSTILDVSNGRPQMSLRVNQRKTDGVSYQKLLSEHGMDTRLLSGSEGVTGSLELAKPVPVEKLPGFTEGWVSVQDAGAQMAAPSLRLSDGMLVLDACAAPGGKSAHILELANVELRAIDNDVSRVARLKQNFTRLGLEPHRVIHGDVSCPEEWWDGRPFDRILADVPCSASGVTRRHPDIKWLRRESDLVQFAARQQEILIALWPMLARSGELLYVTCSIFAEENRAQVEKFLSSHEDARLLPLPWPALINGQLLPGLHHDGFFYALLKKV